MPRLEFVLPMVGVSPGLAALCHGIGTRRYERLTIYYICICPMDFIQKKQLAGTAQAC